VTILPDGGELFVTWSRVLAPRGWPLQTLGVIPQLCTSLGSQNLGLQFNALQAGKSLMAQPDAQARAGRAPMPIDRILAIRDSCPADIGGDLDISAARFVMGSKVAYAAALLP
jgi:carboxyl-terminal processing protease